MHDVALQCLQSAIALGFLGSIDDDGCRISISLLSFSFSLCISSTATTRLVSDVQSMEKLPVGG